MDRFFSPSLSDNVTQFQIQDPDEIHHLIHVLRLKVGDQAEFVNGKGLLVVGEIVAISKSKADVRALEVQRQPVPSGARLVLACAIPKKCKFEDIIDQCTQLGVDEIIPLITERTEVSGLRTSTEAKQSRYEKVMMSAVKQSKRLWAPRLESPAPFAEVISRINADTFAVIPWLEGSRRALNEVLPAAVQKRNILIFIGPEGDFTAEEVQAAMDKGAVPLSLGPNVLRVDTAAAFIVGAFRL